MQAAAPCQAQLSGKHCNSGQSRRDRVPLTCNCYDAVKHHNGPVDAGGDERVLAHFLPQDDWQDEIHRGESNGSHKCHKIPARKI